MMQANMEENSQKTEADHLFNNTIIIIIIIISLSFIDSIIIYIILILILIIIIINILIIIWHLSAAYQRVRLSASTATI